MKRGKRLALTIFIAVVISVCVVGFFILPSGNRTMAKEAENAPETAIVRENTEKDTNSKNKAVEVVKKEKEATSDNSLGISASKQSSLEMAIDELIAMTDGE